MAWLFRFIPSNLLPTYSGFFLQVFPSRNKVNRTNPSIVVVQRRLRNVHKKRNARANFDVLPIKPIAFFSPFSLPSLSSLLKLPNNTTRIITNQSWPSFAVRYTLGFVYRLLFPPGLSLGYLKTPEPELSSGNCRMDRYLFLFQVWINPLRQDDFEK